MTKDEVFNLYVLQSKNVRKLSRVKDNIIKDINHSIRKNDTFLIEIKTKLLALLYCTWSEAQFIQIIHTPNGFSTIEIEQIKFAKNQNIEIGWNKMIDLAFDRVGKWGSNKDLAKRRESILTIVNEYIVSKSILRNKIAHGQWEYALNRENTKENIDLSIELKNMDLVDITKWFRIHEHLALIIRDLVQSPKKGFHINYWTNLTDLEEFIDRSSCWTFETKKSKLLSKPLQHN